MRVLSLDLEPQTDLPPFAGPRWLPPGTPCRSVRVWEEEVPPSAGPFSHLIVSGSTCSILDDHPFVAPAMSLIRDAVARRRPVFGICYGHQLLVRAVLGPDHVRRSATPEMGWLPIEALPAGKEIFDGLPNPFHAFVGHFDEVVGLPGGWDVIARTPDCGVHGFLCRELRLLGVQFHPELDLPTGNVCFTTGREKIEEAGFDVDRILSAARDDGSGSILIPRYLGLTWPE